MAEALVLCYHAISERFPAALSVTPGAFERHLGLLKRAGYRGVTFADAMQIRSGRVVAITFDDAFLSVLQRAKPLLDSVGYPATVYAPTAYLDTPEQPLKWDGIDQWHGGEYEHELLPMSWDQLGELAEAGWEIGSHTRTHPRLVKLDDETLAEELRGSRARLEAELGEPCRSFAYPFGEVDERVIAAARAAGYDAACTLLESYGGTSALSWPRVGIWRSDGPLSFRFKVALRSSAALRVLDRPRRALKRLLRPGRSAHGWARD
jgi:peptidoglycan/xylan/chitin deacetylase (PgdA/CDA1 family)